MSIYDVGLKGLIYGYCALFSSGFEVSGELRLPAGPKIIAANHTTASDPIHLPYLLGEKAHCLSQNNLFAIPILGWLFRKTGQVYVNRQHGHPAYEQACTLLRAGKTIALFPEGRCCPRGIHNKAKSGAVRMALETGAAIIPLGFYVRPQDVLTLSLPWNRSLPPSEWQVKGICHARIGKAWHPNPARSVETQTAELMARIYALVEKLDKESNCCAKTAPSLLHNIQQ